MKFIRKWKYWLIAISLIGFCQFWQSPVFASMGSAGGGSGGGSGGSSGDDVGLDGIVLCFAIVILVIINKADDAKKSSGFKPDNSSSAQLGSGWTPAVLQRKQMGLENKTANQAVLEFRLDWSIERFEKKLNEIGQPYDLAKLKPGLPDELGQIYADAQFYYSEQIREKVAGNSINHKVLAKYIYPVFAVHMHNEILRKAAASSIDDTIISYIKISQAWTLGDNSNYLVVKLTAFGFDNEYNVDHNFESTFQRHTWTDYVIFVKDVKDHWRIANLCYGEHFHLNGKDFNRQQTLTGIADPCGWYKTGYSEHSLDDHQIKHHQ